MMLTGNCSGGDLIISSPYKEGVYSDHSKAVNAVKPAVCCACILMCVL